jgi:transglutaminase-like putative cysteine protease
MSTTSPHRASARGAAWALALLTLASLVLPGCVSRGPTIESQATVERQGPTVAEALERAGKNRVEIEAFLADQAGERQIAAEFLIANLPTVDLVTLTAADLQENLDLAFQARAELPWAGEVPFELFLHYVLPQRVTEEPFTPWRAALYPDLSEELQGCTNMVDAALAVNRWCGQRMGFKQTERRDQSPLSSLKSGIGRCEELMTICICAMRAVGIPARPCSAPWWIVNDNNHAWVEVWADGDWYYLGGCEPAQRLDQGWFTGAAQRAGIVTSYMFGSPLMHPTGEVVARDMGNMAVINSTAVYAATDEVRVRVTDELDLPIADCPVAISCFNFGALRALLSQRTDANGETVLTVGMGDYFVTAGTDGGRSAALVTCAPGADNDLTLVLKPGAAPPEQFWLRYPTAAEAGRARAATAKGLKGAAEATFVPDLPAPPARDLYEAGKDAAFDAIIDASGESEAWRGILTDSFANWRQIATAVKAARPHIRPLLLDFLKQTSRVDRLEITSAILLDHVNFAASRRSPVIDKDLFRASVLNGRIDYEHLAPWRERIWRELRDLAPQSLRSTEAINACAAGVNDYFATEFIDDSERLTGRATRMNPIQVLIAGRGSAAELSIAAVGVLRTFGVPARKAANRALVEYHDGEVWRLFDPTVAGSIKLLAEEGDAAGAEDAEVPAHVRFRFRKDGLPFTDWNKLQYHFDISRFEGGSWRSLRNLQGGPNGEEFVVTLAAGEYLLTSGARNGNGDPFVQTKLVDLEPGAEAIVEWSRDLPEDAGVFRFPMVRKLESLPEIEVPSPTGEMVALADLVQEQPVLLFFFRMDNEPSVRMLPLVNDVALELKERGVHVVGVDIPTPVAMTLPTYEAAGAMPLHLAVVQAAGSPPSYMALADEEASTWEMPSVLLLNRGGGVVLWLEGYELKVGDLLLQATRQLR